MRFLLVEDNDQLAKAICDRLSLDSHIVDHAVSLSLASEYVATTSYDLILLDIMLPDGDGRQFLRHYRAAAGKTPVIVLTARSEVSDRVGVLDLGADDYITKPFNFSELEARCRAVLRRQGGGASNCKRFGNVEFDALAGTITRDGRVTALRNKELRLLEVFLTRQIRFSRNRNWWTGCFLTTRMCRKMQSRCMSRGCESTLREATYGL